MRETIQANYGVSYYENIDSGGSANVKLVGSSYYASPGRTMRRDELENKQVKERESKVKDYQASR